VLADDHLSMLANENLASAMQGAGDLAAAEDYGRIACYLSPSIFLAQRESSCYRLLQIYVQERKLADARRTAVNTARLYPGDEEGTAQLLSAASVIGLLEQAQGDPSGMKVPREVLEKSVPELERAAQIDPLDQVSRMILGQYYRALGEPVRARHCYLELAALAIVDPVLHASAMRSAGEVADEIAAEKDPIKKLYFDAEQAEYDGRTADAIAAWQQALALAPDRADFLVPLADDLNAAGRVEEARDAMLRASQLAPGSAKVWFNLGLYLGGTGDFRGAADAMARAIALQPGWGQAHLHRGMALDRLGDADGAIAEYKTFLAVYFEERQTRDVVQKRIDQIEARRH
jgi:tetratricopeptide (TPR) repeat protein